MSLRPRTGSTAPVGVCGRGLGADQAISQMELALFRPTNFARPGLLLTARPQMELAPFSHFAQWRPGLLPEGRTQMELAPFERPISFWRRSPKTSWTAQPRTERRQGVWSPRPRTHWNPNEAHRIGRAPHPTVHATSPAEQSAAADWKTRSIPPVTRVLLADVMANHRRQHQRGLP